ncbi:MAG TPA: biotin carboxylase N-terminal domain-containing protein, partial [Chloroflexota bacterium]|nr:biotin carboxylase N-terminal domain-containing protein [Chloroflexota bacterium]
MTPRAESSRSGAVIPWRKILIANRGEIAVRVVKAVRALGASPVAVYSEADRFALHVLRADEAYCIGAAPASESYLDIRRILEAARISQAEAIHPGYGFLSENADFAQAVVDAGLVFIGPRPEVIRLMGDKAAAKRLMAEAGVSTIPGYLGADQEDSRLRREAELIGYPLMVKAAAGGGGRGMRVVESAEALGESLEAARREALAAFGDDRLFLEKLLVAPRHIEIQLMADHHGNIVYLGERECSIQRRHQKVVEEAPSTVIDEDTRVQMGETAVRGARAAGYTNAGTMEFLWSQGRFYFLEMNTRIQVEHPVTELVTGIDLVKTQIQVAADRPLPWSQNEIRISGHALECRLYAEDPERDFLPQSGVLSAFEVPLPEGMSRVDILRTSEEPCLRVDAGVSSDSVVPRFYDSLLAKLVVWSPDRPGAIEGMSRVLAGTVVEGIRSNVRFLHGIVASNRFRAGDTTTAFLEEDYAESGVAFTPRDEVAMAALAVELLDPKSWHRPQDSDLVRQVWRLSSAWRIDGVELRRSYVIRTTDEGRQAEEAWIEVAAERLTDSRWSLSVGDRRYPEVTLHVQPSPANRLPAAVTVF